MIILHVLHATTVTLPIAGKMEGNIQLKAKSEANTATSTPYNKLQHGTNTAHPQSRLAKIEGLGYNALDN